MTKKEIKLDGVGTPNDAAQMDIDGFVKGEMAVNQERLRTKLEEKGRSPYIQLKQGVNTMTLLRVIPKPFKNQFDKQQRLFKVEVSGETFELPVTETSPLYTKILKKLKGAPTVISLMRMGEKQNTRLDLLEEE